MRVISVPGRLVRHPVTRRVIDERGVLIDPHDLTWVNLIAAGDLELVEDAAPGQLEPVEPIENEQLTDQPAPPAPVTEQE